MLSNPTIVRLKERVQFKTEQIIKISKLLEYKPAKLGSREFGGCCWVNSSFCMRSKDEGISELSRHTGLYTYARPSQLTQEFMSYQLLGRKSDSYRYKASKPTSTIGLAIGSLEGNKVSQAHRRL